jgi:hypothetical protein
MGKTNSTSKGQERKRKEGVPYNIRVSGFNRDSIRTRTRDEASGPHRRRGLKSVTTDCVIISFLGHITDDAPTMARTRLEHESLFKSLNR